ncbi:amine oxidase (flavin-containing) [Metarhizium anisopliae]
MLLNLVPSALSALCLASTAIAGTIRQRENGPSLGHARDLFLRRILADSPEYGNFRNHVPTKHDELKVGIIGGGVAGLYAAILLESLDIDYEILESSKRIGGRVFTHRFDQKAWEASKPGQPNYYDYYDAGAMRFPGMDWMSRIIGNASNSLIPYINSRLKPGDQPVKLIPYVFQANNTFRLFNDRLVYNQDTPSARTFGVLGFEGGTIQNNSFADTSPGAVFSDAVSDLVHSLEVNFENGFKKLMQYDQISVRQYLATKGYSSQQIDWIETVNDATTHYNTMSLSEAVIEEWIFSEAPLDSWFCVEGGMDRITHGMASIINKTVETGKRVTAIKKAGTGALNVIINDTETRTYSHVINTVPLGAMQVMDMTDLNLDYRKKLAIRKIQYDASDKLSIKFKNRWWEHLDSGSFQGGQSFSDLPIRRCVYPSYGINTPDAPGTMIASYTWAQDSARLGAYCSGDAKQNIVDVALRNLAAMHNVTYDYLRSQYVDSHHWNWYLDENAVGAFALFGPGDLSTTMPDLMQPGAHGRLHFAGDALSSGHAWIIGAVNSAYRTVAEVLAVEKMDGKLAELVDRWGVIEEIDIRWYANGTMSK